MNINTPAAYCDVFELLERRNVRYVVVSGVAVVLHGHIRPIVDLDIVVPAAPDEQNRALHALMLAGFAPSIPVPLAMLRVLRTFDQLEREVDVFVRYHTPFEELWTDSVQIGIGESLARVASLEHLLHAKRITGRPHDLEDIEALTSLEAVKGEK